tara:strand:- start:303 stop:569 length:267 start_codon:yes stop_codon:yes gene_type:complete
MINRPFDINDHPKLLKLKVSYTLDSPYASPEREKLAELIFNTLYSMREDKSRNIEPDEWAQLLDLVYLSRLTVREWLYKYDQPDRVVA